MATRRIMLELVGDSAKLEKAFARSSRSADKFNRNMGAASKTTARRFAALRATIVSGGIALGLRDITMAAAESQQVIGQTSVAVENAGLSWSKYRDQIQKTIRAQSQLGFDDEALLRTFSLFVRSAGSIDEALRRNQIAMDVSRARFIDLESAAKLVNKAALGQAGALRRIGIDARTGATGVELLAQLEREFGGAAEQASDDAATSMQRLQVQVENLKEDMGTLLLPVVTQLATAFGAAAVGAGKFGGAMDKLRIPEVVQRGLFGFLAGPGEKGGFDISALADEPVKALKRFQRQLEKGRAKVEETMRKRRRAGPRGITADQRNQWFDATLARQMDRLQDLSLRKQLARLREIGQAIKQRLAATTDITRRLTLEDQLLDISRQQRDVQAQITDQIKAANEALKARADAIKSAVIERLQRRQTDILNRRALADAREQLRIARQIGGPEGIKQAVRQMQDVRFDMLRARVEAAPATLTGAGRFALAGVTININGVTDPEEVARRVTAILQKRRRRTTNQTRGPAAGSAAGAH